MTEPTPDLLLAVHHLAVLVRDLGLAEAFYRGVLGLPVIRRWTDDAGAPRSVWLGLGGGAFLAVERGAPVDRAATGGRAIVEPPAPAEGLQHAGAAYGWHCVALCIAPETRTEWRARLAAAGVAIERESAYSIYARDPEGNLVALSHWPAAAV